MSKVSTSMKLGVSAKQVWDLIGGFNALPDWHPAVEKSTIEGEEGAESTITLVVNSYDFDEDKDINLFVKATLPGKYTMVKEPPKGSRPPSGDDGGQEEAPGIED